MKQAKRLPSLRGSKPQNVKKIRTAFSLSADWYSTLFLAACQRFVKRACFARGIYKIIILGYNAVVSPIYVGGTR